MAALAHFQDPQGNVVSVHARGRVAGKLRADVEYTEVAVIPLSVLRDARDSDELTDALKHVAYLLGGDA